MHIWQFQDAKAKLTQLVNEAQFTPQIISRRGKPEIVVMSLKSYQEMTHAQEDIVTFLQSSPLYGIDLEIERDTSKIRDLDL